MVSINVFSVLLKITIPKNNTIIVAKAEYIIPKAETLPSLRNRKRPNSIICAIGLYVTTHSNPFLETKIEVVLLKICTSVIELQSLPKRLNHGT